jgi:hypothetical protein
MSGAPDSKTWRPRGQSFSSIGRAPWSATRFRERRYRRRRRSRPPTIPYPPHTDVLLCRLQHGDLEYATTDALWSESIILTTALAERLFKRRRDRLLLINTSLISESGWFRNDSA